MPELDNMPGMTIFNKSDKAIAVLPPRETASGMVVLVAGHAFVSGAFDPALLETKPSVLPDGTTVGATGWFYLGPSSEDPTCQSQLSKLI